MENGDRRCNRCDEFAFKSRPAGRWAYCSRRSVWIPEGIDPGDHRCEFLTIDGVILGAGHESDI